MSRRECLQNAGLHNTLYPKQRQIRIFKMWSISLIYFAPVWQITEDKYSNRFFTIKNTHALLCLVYSNYDIRQVTLLILLNKYLSRLNFAKFWLTSNVNGPLSATIIQIIETETSPIWSYTAFGQSRGCIKMAFV